MATALPNLVSIVEGTLTFVARGQRILFAR